MRAAPVAASEVRGSEPSREQPMAGKKTLRTAVARRRPGVRLRTGGDKACVMARSGWRRIAWHRRLRMTRDDAPTCRPQLCGDTFHDILDRAVVRATEAGNGAQEEVEASSLDQPLSYGQRSRKGGGWKLQHAAGAGLAMAGVASR